MNLEKSGVTELTLSSQKEINGGSLILVMLLGALLLGVAYGIADAIENRKEQ